LKRPLEFALGLLGGMLGVSLGFFVMVIGSITGEVTYLNPIPSAIVFFSVLGIIGSCIVVNSIHTKIAGCLMIISAVGISALGAVIGLPSFLPGILLIIAGLMAVFKNTKSIS